MGSSGGGGGWRPRPAPERKIPPWRRGRSSSSDGCRPPCEGVPFRFVTGYQPELYAADRQLLKFFKRLKPRGGELDYHSFKTRMANMASQLSIRDIVTFCNNAKAA